MTAVRESHDSLTRHATTANKVWYEKQRRLINVLNKPEDGNVIKSRHFYQDDPYPMEVRPFVPISIL